MFRRNIFTNTAIADLTRCADKNGKTRSTVATHEFGHLIEGLTSKGQEIRDWYKSETTEKQRNGKEKRTKSKPMTTFSGLKIDKRNKKQKTEYYKEVSFSYPENVSMKQYAAKVYEGGIFIGETELLSTFFEHLFTDAQSVLTNHKTFSTTILTILEK